MSSNVDHSVTRYIDGLRAGDEVAAQKVWERFQEALIRLANKRLLTSRKAMDEEDVVQIAFAQFFQQVQQGRFSKLDDRHDLWQVLAMLVGRRAKDQDRAQTTQKAGQGKVRTESVFLEKSDYVGIAGMPGMVPTPEMATEVTDQLRRCLGDLKDPDYEQVVMMKLKGYTNSEIAAETGLGLRSVERRLEHIRKKWTEIVDDQASEQT